MAARSQAPAYHRRRDGAMKLLQYKGLTFWCVRLTLLACVVGVLEPVTQIIWDCRKSLFSKIDCSLTNNIQIIVLVAQHATTMFFADFVGNGDPHELGERHIRPTQGVPIMLQ
jgi:hypothetical protein